MRIAGTGIDVAEVSRIARVLERHGGRFLRRVFTAAEASYCLGCAVPARHLAGRFAAKEAVLKALGTGWAGGIGWRDVEVERDAVGAPRVRLSGGAARRAEAMGVVRVHVSISHTDEQAIAHAIAEARDE